jgi:hypothetical protein
MLEWDWNMATVEKERGTQEMEAIYSIEAFLLVSQTNL